MLSSRIQTESRHGSPRVLLIWILLLSGELVLAAGDAETGAAGLRNLAEIADITASGALSDAYHPRHVADGLIPEQGCRRDEGAA